MGKLLHVGHRGCDKYAIGYTELTLGRVLRGRGCR